MHNRIQELKQYLTPGRHVHLVGIGGVSMRPLGLVLKDMGLYVTGSDMNSSVSTDELIAKGIAVAIGHRAENIHGAACVIRTAAAHNDNPEIAEARHLGIPVFERAEAWGVIMQEYRNAICIAGTQTIDIRNTNDMSESSILTYGWTLHDWYAGNELTILMSLTEQGDDPTALRLIRGQTSRDVRMHAGCTEIMLGENYIYGFAGSTIIGVPVAGGATQSWSLPYSADKILCRLSGSRALLSGEGKVFLVELP